MMVNNMLVIGEIIKCMVNKEDLNGQTEDYILVIILKIKNMDMVEYNGPMEKFMKESGRKEYNMEEAKLKELMVLNIKVNGKMEKE
jgi:hypothetical protein